MKFDSRIRPLKHTTLEVFTIKHGVTMVDVEQTREKNIHTIYKLHGFREKKQPYSHAPAYCRNGECSSFQFKNKLHYCCSAVVALRMEARAS